MPSHSLFARAFSPVPTYIFAKGILFLAFLRLFHSSLEYFSYICTRNPQGVQDILLNRLSIATREETSKHTLLGLPHIALTYTTDFDPVSLMDGSTAAPIE